VWTDVFDETSRAPLAHIQLAQMADYVVVAPATANSIAKFAHGLGEDIVSLTLLATRAPVILAPAMHEAMWTNTIVQENVACLKARGYHVVEPEVGLQPEGTVAGGRMAAISTIIARLIEIDRSISVEAKAVVTVRVFGVPTANGCDCGTQGTSWREATAWVARSLKTCFGDQVRVEYLDLFFDALDAFPQVMELIARGEANPPLVFIGDELFSSGGKISGPAIRKRLETVEFAEVK